jgi:hypothetical protein
MSEENNNGNNNSCDPPAYCPPWRAGCTPSPGYMDDPRNHVEPLPPEPTPVEIERIHPALFYAQPEADFEEIEEDHAGHNFSAGKSKWLIDPNLLPGNQHDPVIRFFPLSQDPLANNSFPANVPAQDMVHEDSHGPVDTFRYVSGKFWLHRGHGEGIQPSHWRRGLVWNGKPEFSYYNSSNTLCKGSGHTLSKADPNDVRVLPQEEWLNSDLVLSSFTSWRETEGGLDLPIFHESFKITFPPHPEPGGWSSWKWRDYMYGLAGHLSELGTLSRAETLEFGRTHARTDPRFLPSGPDSLLTWPNWGDASYTKNLFPVIPFFGDMSLWDDPDGAAFRDPSFRPPHAGGLIFFDHATNIPDFMTKEELEETDFNPGLYSDVRGVYNFYDCVYEELISPNYTENRLPNYYRMRPEKRNKRNTVTEEYFRKNIAESMSGDEGSRQQEIIRRKAIENYGVFDPIGHPVVNTWDVFENPGLEEFKTIYDERRVFPMYAEIEFTSNERSLFVESLEMGSEKNFMREIMVPLARTSDGAGEPMDRQLINNLPMKVVTQFLGGGTSQEEEERARTWNIGSLSADTTVSMSDVFKHNVRSMSLEAWMQWLSQEEEAAQEQEDVALSPQDRFRSLIGKIVIKSRIKQIIEQTYREKFTQVLNGKPAHSEILAYRVEKLVNGTPIQNFFFATNNDVEIVRYLDSQVEYGKQYSYKVHAISLVVGTKYAYVDCMTAAAVENFYNQSRDPRRISEMFFGVMHKPSVLVVEVPMQERSVTIIDKPPIPPDVNIIPFKGVKNRILFNLNGTTGEMAANPVILEEDDYDQFRTVVGSQYPSGRFWRGRRHIIRDQIVHFRNDDPVKVFEIFRTDEEPTSWESFFDKKIQRIESEATNASHVDVISPNKKYYYAFRTEDIHGHPSNPSHIYQVELVADDEMTFLKMDIFNFKEEIEPRKMSFDHKIEISPSSLQRVLPMPSNGSLETWDAEGQPVGDVGTAENPRETLWGKQFKCRITSRSTGKQIDINFKFKKKYTKIEEEIQNNVDINNKC